MTKLKILWGSETPTQPTGYAIVTRELSKRLCERGHEVSVIGWNYNGEEIKHEEGWSLLHAGIGNFGADALGTNMTVIDYHMKMVDPDIFVSLVDPWYIGHMVRSANVHQTPHLAYLPIDGWPISYAWKDLLKMVHTPMWMSRFGQSVFYDFVKEYASTGTGGRLRDPMLDRYLDDPGPMLYHGVDTEVFKPMTNEEKFEARSKIGLTDFDFIYLSVGRNANRKQQPRLLQAFALTLTRVENPEKHCLLIHCGDATDARGSGGWNLPLMVKQMGLENNVRFTDMGNPLFGLDRPELARLYGCADVHVLSTGGEGFGVPTAEALSCGIPVILPDNSTGKELSGASEHPTDASRLVETERGWLVKCSDSICSQQWAVNMGLVDIAALSDAMVAASQNPDATKSKSEACRSFAENYLDWEIITDYLEQILIETAEKDHPLGMNATAGMI